MKFKELLKYRMWGYKHQAVTLLFFSIMFSMIILGAIVVYTVCFYAEQNVGKYADGSIQIKSCDDDQDEKYIAEGQRISYDWVKAFSTDERIKNTEMVSMAGVHGKNVTHMLLNDEALDSEDENGNLLLIYQKNVAEHYTFKEWGDTIIEGRSLEANETGNKAVIGRTFAEGNNLSLGDVIELESLSGEELCFDIVGISSCEYQGNMVVPVRAAEYNYIFTTKEMVDRANQSPNVFKVEFKLTDCKDAAVIFDEIQEKVNGKGYIITSKLTGYHNILAGFANSQTTVSVLLVMAVVMGGFIIGLFSVYSLTQRLKEIGILLSIGFKKGVIILQYVLELFIPVFIGNLSTLCVFVLARKALTKFIINKFEIIPEMSISLNLVQLIGYSGCCLFLVLFSTIFVCYIVMKYNPKKLLMETK